MSLKQHTGAVPVPVPDHPKKHKIIEAAHGWIRVLPIAGTVSSCTGFPLGESDCLSVITGNARRSFAPSGVKYPICGHTGNSGRRQRMFSWLGAGKQPLTQQADRLNQLNDQQAPQAKADGLDYQPDVIEVKDPEDKQNAPQEMKEEEEDLDRGFFI